MKKKSDNPPNDDALIEGLFGLGADIDEEPPEYVGDNPLFFFGDYEDVPEKPERFFMPGRHRKMKKHGSGPVLAPEEEEPVPKTVERETTPPEAFGKDEAQNGGDKKPARKTGTFGVVRFVLLFICAAVFVFCSCTLISSAIERARSRKLYDDMRRVFYNDAGFEDSYLSPGVQDVPSVDLLSAYAGVQPQQQEPALPSGSRLADKVNYLKGVNPDTVGWLTVDGTSIDYPVVRFTDNDFYLRRDFYGRSNIAGTLFMDYRDSFDLTENRNTVVYGHNMNDGSMFNNLHDFKKESVFKNGRIRFVTSNGTFIYEVFSVHEAHETSEYFQTDFASDAGFASYLADMQAQSLYKKEGVTLTPADKVLTLSTCVDSIVQSEYRWAVHAKLVQVIDRTE